MDFLKLLFLFIATCSLNFSFAETTETIPETPTPTTTPAAIDWTKYLHCTNDTLGYHRNPYDPECRMFYRCDDAGGDKGLVIYSPCLKGEMFDEDIETCLPDEQYLNKHGKCVAEHIPGQTTATPVKSSTIESSEVTETPEKTTKPTTTKLVTSAPTTMSLSSTWTPDGTMIGDEFLHCDKDNIGLHRNPYKCSQFYYCYPHANQFVKVNFQCHDGKVFDDTQDADEDTCISQEAYRHLKGHYCLAEPLPDQTSTSAPRTSTALSFNWGNYLKCTEEGSFANPYQCGLYYLCRKTGHLAMTMARCPPLHIFDNNVSKCIPSQEYTKKYGQCHNKPLPLQYDEK